MLLLFALESVRFGPWLCAWLCECPCFCLSSWTRSFLSFSCFGTISLIFFYLRWFSESWSFDGLSWSSYRNWPPCEWPRWSPCECPCLCSSSMHSFNYSYIYAIFSFLWFQALIFWKIPLKHLNEVNKFSKWISLSGCNSNSIISASSISASSSGLASQFVIFLVIYFFNTDSILLPWNF